MDEIRKGEYLARFFYGCATYALRLWHPCLFSSRIPAANFLFKLKIDSYTRAAKGNIHVKQFALSRRPCLGIWQVYLEFGKLESRVNQKHRRCRLKGCFAINYLDVLLISHHFDYVRNQFMADCPSPLLKLNQPNFP